MHIFTNSNVKKAWLGYGNGEKRWVGGGVLTKPNRPLADRVRGGTVIQLRMDFFRGKGNDSMSQKEYPSHGRHEQGEG